MEMSSLGGEWQPLQPPPPPPQPGPARPGPLQPRASGVLSAVDGFGGGEVATVSSIAA